MIRYLIFDVDGTFTDGSIYYDDRDNEIKKFCTKDGTGIAMARQAGIYTVVLTGRECSATSRRMAELHIDLVVQGVTDKAKWIRNWMEDNGIRNDSVGYIGDDINDLEAMKICGWTACPGDAAYEVRLMAHYVSPILGGHGAVRDCIESILRDQNMWTDLIGQTYGTGQ